MFWPFTYKTSRAPVNMGDVLEEGRGEESAFNTRKTLNPTTPFASARAQSIFRISR